MELEGLRAIAAIVVVFYHAALIFYPGYFYGVGSSFAPVQNMRFEDNLYQNPLAGLLSGTFAVGIFFVLSGFVLAIGFFHKKDANIIKKMAAKRYPRLMLPALASVMVVWVIVSLGLHNISEVAAATHSGWISRLWTFPPDLLEAIRQGVVTTFTVGEASKDSYNPVLWTIRHEFIGSFLVFGTALLFSSSRYRLIVYVGLMIALFNTWLLGFVIGMLFADVYVNRHSIFRALNVKYTYILMILGVVLGGYPAGHVTSPLYQALQIPGLDQAQFQAFYTAIGASLVILGILSLTRMKKFFALPLISGIGKYTYSLYLIHMPVLFTVCTGSFMLLFTNGIGFHVAAVSAIATASVALVGVTYIFYKYIDAPSIRFANFCEEVFVGKRNLPSSLKESYLRFKLNMYVKVSSLKNRKNPEIMPEAEID